MLNHESQTTRSATVALLLGLGVPLVLAAPRYGEWLSPVNLGAPVNTASNDFGPALSRDRLSLFFNSDRQGGMGGQDIWVSQRASEEDAWGEPVNLGPPVNTAFGETVPSFSRDGHSMFFNSNRPGGSGDSDIWIAQRVHTGDDFAWDDPVNAGPGINSASFDAGASYLENEDAGTPLLYFQSDRPGGLGSNDIYVSTQAADGSWEPATHVAELSSPQSDQRPNVRFDGLEIFLFSSRPGGAGPSDIWVSTRQTTVDNWSPPVNLGGAVNSTSAEFQTSISSDRETLVFASNRTGGLGGVDLYVTTRKKNP